MPTNFQELIPNDFLTHRKYDYSLCKSKYSLEDIELSDVECSFKAISFHNLI